MNYLEMKKHIEDVVAANLDEMIAHSDYLTDHPEESGQEAETSKKIVELLRTKGWEVEYPFGGFDYAFKAVIGPNNHKYKVSLLAEYDALPEIGHACGHSVSGTITLLAAIAACGLQDELDCDIHVIGTPQEETDGAKCKFSDDGIFKEYDMSMMIHMYDRNLSYCTLNGLSSEMYEFHGKASHAGASPWDGQNALNAAMLMIHGLDCIRGCCLPNARINSVIHKGGFAGGSIPEYAQIETWVRCPEEKPFEQLMQRALNCAEGAALMAECTWEHYPTAAIYKTMRRNYTGEAVIENVFEELGIEKSEAVDLFGSSDMGNVSIECPAFHPTLQIAPSGVPIHSREFLSYVKSDAAHKAIADGAKVIALTVAQIFSDEEKIKKMKADFEANA